MSVVATRSTPPSLSEFVSEGMLRDARADSFTLIAPDLLRVEVNGRLRARADSLVAGSGRLGVTPASRFGSLAAKDPSGGVLAGIDGRGSVYLADSGKRITLLLLRADETLGVAPHALLAAEDTVSIHGAPVRIPAPKPVDWHGVLLRGPGRVAFASRGEPQLIRVTQDASLFVRPGAVVAWAAGLEAAGRAGSADTRIAFVGHGFVYVQSGA